MSATEVFSMRCAACEWLGEPEEAENPVYECGRCGQSFSREEADDSSRCPSCNVFSAKVAEHACPECGEHDELEQGEFHPPPPPTAEEVAEQEAAAARHAEWHEERMREHRAENVARERRWLGDDESPGLAAAFDGVADALAERCRQVFGMASLSCDLRWQEAEAIARALLGLPPEPPLADALNFEARSARWARDYLARAFEGIDGTEFMVREFASGRSVGVGMDEQVLAAIAVRLQATTKEGEGA